MFCVTLTPGYRSVICWCSVRLGIEGLDWGSKGFIFLKFKAHRSYCVVSLRRLNLYALLIVLRFNPERQEIVST